jgi:hypothetical protein
MFRFSKGLSEGADGVVYLASKGDGGYEDIVTTFTFIMFALDFANI